MLMVLAMLAAQVPADAAECTAGPAEALVGEHYRRHVPTRAKKLSGASRVRVIYPGQMMTEEFRSDRINLLVDHRRQITDVRCG